MQFKLIILVEYIPAWFPGANFQRIAKANRQLVGDMRYLGYDAAHAAHVSLNQARSIPLVFILTVRLFLQKNGHRDESLVSRILDEEGPSDTLRDTIGSLFAGRLSPFPLLMRGLTEWRLQLGQTR